MEPGPGKTHGRAEGRQPESRQRERVTRDVDDGAEQLAAQLRLVAGERREQSPPGGSIIGPAVGVEVGGGRGE